jgi:hypothetical protein
MLLTRFLSADGDGVPMMSVLTKDNFRSLLYLVSLSVVGAATVGVFFGFGFLWLTDPNPATPPVDPVLSAHVLEADAIPAPAASDTVWGSLAGSSADNVTVSPTSDAAPNREVQASRSTAMETTLVTPAGTIRAKRVRVSWRRHEATGRQWAALWRPDASAGPNPGGGFYGAPNINVGRINPR